MSDFWEKVVLLILGFLFGLLGPAIIEAIGVRRTITSLRQALRVELLDLRARLVEAAFTLAEVSAQLDQSNLLWFRERLSKIPGASESTRELVESLLAVGAEQASNIVAERAKQLLGETVLLPSYHSPVLDMTLQYLSHFSSTVQPKLLEIKTQLSFLDVDAADIRSQFLLSFQKYVAKELGPLVQDNFITTYREAFVSCKTIINSAETILAEIGGT